MVTYYFTPSIISSTTVDKQLQQTFFARRREAVGEAGVNTA